MTKKIYILTSFILLVLLAEIKAQQSQPSYPDINTATIPSADAVSLDKLITQQVDLYTGKPNIEIPLFVAKSRKLSVPIKLQYNSSGCVVTEHSSWVGNGWSLSAGGQISRQVRGNPDEKDGVGYFYLGHYLPSNPLELTSEYFTYDQQKSIANQTWDLEPDMFNFSFGGYSGQFIFYVDSLGNRTIQTIPYQNLNIVMDPDLSSSRIKGFTIISEDGTKYYFGENTQNIENQSNTNFSPENGWENSLGFNSAWMLFKIISPDKGDSITFNYEIYGNEHTEMTSVSSKSGALDFGACYQLCSFPIYFNTNYFSSEDIASPKLHSITTANEQYVFTTQTESRKDLDGGKVLSSIEQSYNNTPLKKYKFYTSYSGPNLNSFDGCRLFLDSIAEYNSQNTTDKPPYKFYYKDRNLVPSTISYDQDHWGFYNRKNNQSLIPRMDFNSLIHIGDADRSTDTAYSGVGILQQISFPTGGYTKLNYEPNTYGYTSGYYVVKQYVTIPGERNIVADTCIAGDGTKTYDSSSFRINYDQNVKLEMWFRHCRGAEFIGEMRILDSLHNPILDLTAPPDNLNPSHTSDSIHLVKGHYFMDVSVGLWNKCELKVQFQNIEEGADTDRYGMFKYCGGVRVKSIITNDGISTRNEIWKTYNYDEINGGGKSSGTLLSDLPRYDRIQYLCCCDDQTLQTCCKTYATVSANPCNLLSYFNGDIVCYTNVTESIGENSEFGKNVYYFSYVNDIATLNFPLAPGTNRRWRRGILYEKDSYDSLGNVKYKESYSEQFPSDGNNDPHFKRIVAVKGAWIKHGCCLEPLNKITIQPYEIWTEWHHPKEKISRTFGTSGQDTIVIDEKYFYENPNHVQRTKMTVNKSNGDLLITKFVYPGDIGLSSINWGDPFSEAVYRMANDYHIENTVIEQTNFVQKGSSVYLLGSKATYYKPFTNGSSIYRILPDKEYLLNLDNPISGSNFSQIHHDNDNKIVIDSKYDHAPELVYEQYDKYGNIIQYKPRTSPRVSFLFGYNGEFPLAKAINTTAANISYDPGSGQITVPINAFLTTYTFHPVYGMTSETDPNGISTYYEYDDSGRLKFIKDNNHNILKRFLYHYKLTGQSK